MCGIVGTVGPSSSAPFLIEGLRKLEYRGYDSAGIAINEAGELLTLRSEGKLRLLAEKVMQQPLSGTTGIGHTRWATHGRPTENNAHPHRSGNVAVVHNGIIENYLALREELQAEGYHFSSETDSEVIAHMVAKERKAGLALREAVRQVALRLEGAFAIVVIDASEPDTLVGVKMASPLVVGIGKDSHFLASDVAALLSETRDMVFLNEGELVQIHAKELSLLDMKSGEPKDYEVKHISWSPSMAEKGGYKHFMLKEIFEQPRAISDTLRGRILLDQNTLQLDELALSKEQLERASQIYLVACGTSWHAALVGKYFFESLAGMAVHVELASELRYRDAPINDKSIVIALSQSGETADTLAALQVAKEKGATLLSVCNVIDSSIARLSDGTLYTHAGPEISVASTKAFTTQLVALHMMAIHFGQILGFLSEARIAKELQDLLHAPSLVEATLGLTPSESYLGIARRWKDAHSMLYLGRGPLYPLALEGALKLKEISYIHAEGQAAGEMKHGPIALIDEQVPTVILNPMDPTYQKVRSNFSEIKARSGPVILLRTEGDENLDEADHVLTLPEAPPLLLPLLSSIPMQLLAYYMADFKGTDVDQPRNLAKSVTVE